MQTGLQITYGVFYCMALYIHVRTTNKLPTNTWSTGLALSLDTDVVSTATAIWNAPQLTIEHCAPVAV